MSHMLFHLLYSSINKLCFPLKGKMFLKTIAVKNMLCNGEPIRRLLILKATIKHELPFKAIQYDFF